MNTFIRQKAEQTDRQAGRQTNKLTNKNKQVRTQSYKIKEMTKK